MSAMELMVQSEGPIAISEHGIELRKQRSIDVESVYGR
jgi:hypothetical protein